MNTQLIAQKIALLVILATASMQPVNAMNQNTRTGFSTSFVQFGQFMGKHNPFKPLGQYAQEHPWRAMFFTTTAVATFWLGYQIHWEWKHYKPTNSDALGAADTLFPEKVMNGTSKLYQKDSAAEQKKSSPTPQWKHEKFTPVKKNEDPLSKLRDDDLN